MNDVDGDVDVDHVKRLLDYLTSPRTNEGIPAFWAEHYPQLGSQSSLQIMSLFSMLSTIIYTIA